MTVWSQAGGGEGAAFCVCPGPGGQTEPEPRSQDRDGTSCVYSTKAFLFIQKSTIGFILQILKKVGRGQGFCHSALILINLLSLGSPGRGRLEHTFNNAGLEAQGLGDILALRSPPTCSLPPSLQNRHPMGQLGPPSAFAAQRHQGAHPCSLRSSLCSGNRAALCLAAWGFFQGEAASPRGTQAPQSLTLPPPHRRDNVPESPGVPV